MCTKRYAVYAVKTLEKIELYKLYSKRINYYQIDYLVKL